MSEDTRERIELDPAAMKAAHQAHQQALLECMDAPCYRDHLEEVVRGYLAALRPSEPAPKAEAAPSDVDLLNGFDRAARDDENMHGLWDGSAVIKYGAARQALINRFAAKNAEIASLSAQIEVLMEAGEAHQRLVEASVKLLIQWENWGGVPDFIERALAAFEGVLMPIAERDTRPTTAGDTTEGRT